MEVRGITMEVSKEVQSKCGSNKKTVEIHGSAVEVCGSTVIVCEIISRSGSRGTHFSVAVNPSPLIYTYNTTKYIVSLLSAKLHSISAFI